MKYRLHFEPMDVNDKTREQIELIYRDMKEKCKDGDIVYGSDLIPDIRKIVPIDEDGFPIEQKKIRVK